MFFARTEVNLGFSILNADFLFDRVDLEYFSKGIQDIVYLFEDRIY